MSCGNTLKKTAVLILILGCIALIVAHFIELSACTEPLAEAEEAILEHKDNRVHDADCSTCEELEEARATIYKAMALIWATSIKSLMFLCIGCGILVGIGEIAENTALTKEYTRDISKSSNTTAQNTIAAAPNFYKFNPDSNRQY